MKYVLRSLPAVRFVSLFACVLLFAGCAQLRSPGAQAIHDGDLNGLKQVLDSGVSPDYVEDKEYQDYPGRSLLTLSALHGRNDMTELLLQRGADPHKAAPNLFVNMYLMSEDAALAAARMLLDKGVDPNMLLEDRAAMLLPEDGATPLHLTCRQPRVTELLLTKGARVNAVWTKRARGQEEPGSTLPKERPVTPLGGCLGSMTSEQFTIESLQSTQSGIDLSAAIKKHVEWRNRALESSLILLKHGADPNVRGTINGIPHTLLNIAYLSKQPRLVQAMLDSGADVLAHAPDYTTSLHIVSQQGDARAASDLVSRARIAAKDRAHGPGQEKELFYSWLNQARSLGITALHDAARNEATSVISVLMEAGADPSIKDKSGLTARDHLDRKIAEARERQRIAQANQQRQQQEASQSSGFQWEKALIGLGTGAALGGGMSSAAKREYVTGVLADSMPGQEGFANTAAKADAYAAEQKVRQDIADQQFRDRQAQKMLDEAANNERLLQAASDSRQPNGGQQAGRQTQVDKAKFPAAPREARNNLATASPAVAGQTPRGNETWHDDYSNTVTKTGVTKSFPDHERNIPVSYIASKLKDRASAEAVWANQGGKVIDFYGSVASGKITVVVDFGYIVDTHVYVRDN